MSLVHPDISSLDALIFSLPGYNNDDTNMLLNRVTDLNRGFPHEGLNAQCQSVLELRSRQPFAYSESKYGAICNKMGAIFSPPVIQS
jgi:hypothetical protein